MPLENLAQYGNCLITCNVCIYVHIMYRIAGGGSRTYIFANFTKKYFRD